MQHSNLIIFLAEVAGTFGLLVAATGSIVYDGKVNGELGIVFISVMHFVGLSVVVFLFGKYSMAHFNPAVTVGFFISGHIASKKIPLYFGAQAIGAFLGSLFVKVVFGDFANLGLNYPNSAYSIPLIFGVETVATIFLMGGILLIVSIRKIPMAIVSMVIGGIVALDVLFFGPISGGSMNPIRSLSPAMFVGVFDDLWLYWTAPFVGSLVSAFSYRMILRRKCVIL